MRHRAPPLDVPLTRSAQAQFASKIVKWQELHGRRDLPWQNTRDPYKVWLSEIMLQQTQVSTVLGYFGRFLQRFPSVESLADASIDDVLALWSGLGYYSRARNMHQCAQDVMMFHGGKFPCTAARLQSLPGIGPSTAAAIAAFCFSERVAILDGNVKRVLTRVLAFEGDISQSANQRVLWLLANTLPPKRALATSMPRYTQGMMDLGATVCTLRKPTCCACPVQSICQGLLEGKPEKYPVKTRKIKRSVQQLWLLWAQTQGGAVWLVKRPNSGVWGGLYCLPVFDSKAALIDFVPESLQKQIVNLPTFKHVLTHKDLQLSPVQIKCPSAQMLQIDPHNPVGRWFAQLEFAALGLPAPIRKLLDDELA